jgi:hypothetical protein
MTTFLAIMDQDNMVPPDGFHYRGMIPTSKDSKLCAYMSVEKSSMEWKDRYAHLWTYDKNNLKETNGKTVPFVRCTVCNKKSNMTFQTNGKSISFTNVQKHVKEVHMTELSASDQHTKKEVVYFYTY